MTKVKICGITNVEDALAAVDCGADALGFVFAASPRRVTAETVRDIVGKLPPFVCRVGVYVNSDIALVQETMSFCGLDMAQLHGDEGPELCAALFPRAIKVFTPGALPSRRDMARYRAAAFMVDRDRGPAAGDADADRLWQLARSLKSQGPVILAGGLTPETVGLAIEEVEPYAVDVCSGVESSPGRKDHARLRAFIEAAKSWRPTTVGPGRKDR